MCEVVERGGGSVGKSMKYGIDVTMVMMMMALFFSVLYLWRKCLVVNFHS